MRGALLTLVLAVYLITNVFGQCKISEKKLNKEVKHYEKKCLKKGEVLIKLYIMIMSLESYYDALSIWMRVRGRLYSVFCL